MKEVKSKGPGKHKVSVIPHGHTQAIAAKPEGQLNFNLKPSSGAYGAPESQSTNRNLRAPNMAVSGGQQRAMSSNMNASQGAAGAGRGNTGIDS